MNTFRSQSGNVKVRGVTILDPRTRTISNIQKSGSFNSLASYNIISDLAGDRILYITKLDLIGRPGLSIDILY